MLLFVRIGITFVEASEEEEEHQLSLTYIATKLSVEEPQLQRVCKQFIQKKKGKKHIFLRRPLLHYFFVALNRDVMI